MCVQLVKRRQIFGQTPLILPIGQMRNWSNAPYTVSLSAYLANSLIVDLDRSSGPPQPANPRQ